MDTWYHSRDREDLTTMIIMKENITTDLRIESVHDLHKLKPFLEDSTLKVNKSQIARELNVNRKTVDKYINGFKKAETRDKPNVLEDYLNIITDLLSDECQQIFYYKRILWQFLKDNHNYTGSYTNFVKNLRKYPELNEYFTKRRPNNSRNISVRFETGMGKQAQIDWKESIEFILSTGEIITINVFVYLLAYSRFRIYRLSIGKTQEILLHFLDEAFELSGGVPDEIICDNMRTVMDQARTEFSSGKVNIKFQQFAQDYGFAVKPCIAGKPQTKAKVEAPMKLLDEIRAYNTLLDYTELHALVERINNRVNLEVNQGTGRIPLMYFQKEKTFLSSIPTDTIRKSYQITTYTAKVNTSSMFRHRTNQYSVPPEYVGRTINYQIYDGQIHVYYNTILIAIHQPSNNRLNYHKDYYEAIARKSNAFREERIQEIASQNLKTIGEVYQYDEYV